jgi:hypothetical protein
MKKYGIGFGVRGDLRDERWEQLQEEPPPEWRQQGLQRVEVWWE